MPDLQTRLTGCFQTVFPTLPEPEILNASQTSVADWDSVAAITLANVVEEEFQIQLDFDLLPDLDSYQRILQHLQTLALT
jgi:acyl carrier protein